MYRLSDQVDALILADLDALIPAEDIPDGLNRMANTGHALLHTLDKSKINYAGLVAALVSKIPGGVRPAQRPTLQNTYFNLVTSVVDPLYQHVLAQSLDVPSATVHLASIFPHIEGDLSPVAEQLTEHWLILPLEGLRIPIDEIVNAIIQPAEREAADLEQHRHELGYFLAAPWEEGGSAIQLILVSLLSSMAITAAEGAQS